MSTLANERSTEERTRHLPACPPPYPGAMETLVSLSLKFQNRQQPDLTVAAALAAMSACLSGRIGLHDELRGNLYIVGLAGSGAGKNGPLNLVRTLLDVAGIGEDAISNAGSGQGIEDALLESPEHRAALVVDEVAHLIRGFGKGARHMDSVEKLLLEGYSASSGYLKTRALARRPPVRLPNPYLTLFGTTTHASMIGVSPGLIENGLLGRCLVVSGLDFAPLTETEPGSLRPYLEGMLGELARSVARSGGVIPMTHAAHEAEMELSRHLDSVSQTTDGVGRTLSMRSIEHIKRIALVLAAWENGVIAVTPDHLEWAANFVAFSQGCLMQYVDTMTDSEAVRNAQRIVRIMADAIGGKSPFRTSKHSQYNMIASRHGRVGHSALLKASRLSAAAFETSIDYLLAIRTVDVEMMPREGRGGPTHEKYYVLLE